MKSWWHCRLYSVGVSNRPAVQLPHSLRVHCDFYESRVDDAGAAHFAEFPPGAAAMAAANRRETAGDSWVTLRPGQYYFAEAKEGEDD